MKQGLDKQIQEKNNNLKQPFVADYDYQLLHKTPLRKDMSSLSDMQIQKGRLNTQAGKTNVSLIRV